MTKRDHGHAIALTWAWLVAGVGLSACGSESTADPTTWADVSHEATTERDTTPSPAVPSTGVEGAGTGSAASVSDPESAGADAPDLEESEEGEVGSDGSDTTVAEPNDAREVLKDLPAGAIPEGGERIAGIEFFRRIVGKWSGPLKSYTLIPNLPPPLDFAFPMTVDFAASSDNMIFGHFEVIPKTLTVSWGFNIETYFGKDVLAYRNGGFLGAKRDSRTRLVDYDPARGYYHFCAVKELGIPGFGCDWIEASYTFTGPDTMVFEVSTLGTPHIRWEARRVQKHELPMPFPATSASQGNGSAPWPEEAGL